MEAVLKTVEPQGSGGSNPSPSDLHDVNRVELSTMRVKRPIV